MSIDSINASASPEVQMNDGFTTLEHQSVYGKRPSTTTGLTWGYYGGRWGGIAVTAGTLSLTNAATNYIVVLKSTGAVSVSTASTNWDNTELYARVYKLTTAGSVVTATEDHRAGLYGVMGFDTTILAANEATDTSCFVAFVTAASGQLQVKTNTNLTFNSSTGMLTSLAATITTLTATNLSATVPTTGWYSPGADAIRTPNSVTVDDNLVVSGSGTNNLSAGSTQLGKVVYTANSDIYETTTNALASLNYNYSGYAGGSTQFRDFKIYDGKTILIASFEGTTKATTLAGAVTTGGAIRASYANPVVSVAGLKVGGNAWLIQTVDADGRFRVYNDTNSQEAIAVAFATGAVTLLSTLTVSGASLAIGTTPATGGVIRIPNNTAIRSRNGANTADIDIVYLSASNVIRMGADLAVDSGGLSVTTLNGGIDLGLVGTANNPYVDFHSSANSNDYDSRIQASGGAASAGQGTLTFTAASAVFGGTLTVSGASLSVGTTPAAAGIVRVPNNSAINARNAANTGDLNLIYADASNIIQVGGGTAANVGGDFTVNSSAVIKAQLPSIGSSNADGTNAPRVYNTSDGSNILTIGGNWSAGSTELDLIATNRAGMGIWLYQAGVDYASRVMLARFEPTFTVLPLPVAVGGATASTSTGLITPAGTTALSSLRIPHGSAPTSPVNGDMWTTTAGLFVRINGATVGPLT